MSAFERGDRVSMFTFILEAAINDLDEPIRLLLDQACVASVPGDRQKLLDGALKARGVQLILEAHLAKAEPAPQRPGPMLRLVHSTEGGAS